ncbi:MAG: hypothetical protein M3Y87_31085 [Myxococcota bacterium]|nr:hypothetical protein [Myxococcota bacterium]
MKRLVLILIAIALAPLAGCSLALDANDHLGGAPTVDAGRFDAGAVDASLPDGGDAGMADGPDAGPPDAGPDAGPPIPECAADADCGAPGVASCIAERCVFCAGATDSVTVASSTAYDRRLSMAIGSDGAASEIGLAWTGSGSSAYLYRTPVIAPLAAPGTLPSRTDALLMQLRTQATQDVVSIDVGDGYYEPTERLFELAVVVRDPARSGHNYALWSPTGFTHHTFPNPADYVEPVRDLAPLVLWGAGGRAIGRRNNGLGGIVYVSYETSYGNEQTTYVRSELPADDLVEPAFAGRLVGMPTASGLLLWDGIMGNTPAVIPTSDRSGRASMALRGGDVYVVAFPAGSQVRVRSLTCAVAAISSCMYDASIASDIDTGAESVDAVAVVSSMGRPVVVSYERHAGGEGRLVMRVLRPSGLPYDAPGGGTALVLDTLAAGTTISDARLALAPDGTGRRYVAAWMRGPEGAGARDVRVRSIPVACGL